jgi:hypothetical protein
MLKNFSQTSTGMPARLIYSSAEEFLTNIYLYAGKVDSSAEEFLTNIYSYAGKVDSSARKYSYAGTVDSSAEEFLTYSQVIFLLFFLENCTRAPAQLIDSLQNFLPYFHTIAGTPDSFA